MGSGAALSPQQHEVWRNAGAPARDPQRGTLCLEHRLPMARPSQRPAAAQHGAWLVRALALRWRARPAAFRALPAGSRTGGTPCQPHHRYRGQPERQERRKRGRHIDPIGYDAAKKIKGKKRHLIVDTLGLMLGLDVTPADVQDRDGFLPLLKRVRRVFVFLERLFADGAYSGTGTAAAAKRDGKVTLEIVKRSDAANGCVVLPKRWIVLSRTILPVSASSGQPWSLASLCPGPSGTRAPWPS